MRFDAIDPAAHALPPSVTDELLTPALVVHLEHVRANVARVLELCGGDASRWRPHVKTTKMRPIFVELARAGVRAFKCATTREASELAAALEDDGVSGADVLVAYPLIGPALARLAEIAREHAGTRFSVLCEHAAGVASIPRELGVLVDVNSGMDRTGVPLARRDAIVEIARAAGARFRGIHAYEGHLHERDLALRERRAFEGYGALLELARALEDAGAPAREIVTSGTPGLLPALAFAPFRALRGALHRVSPGTVVFHDLRSEEETPALGLVPAATVLTRVVSRPAPAIATCDAGSKALAADAGDPAAYVLGHPDWTALTPSEEHLPLRVPPGDAPARGALLQLVPRHVCPTINLAEEAILVERGRVVAIVPVSARAHELRAPAPAAAAPR